MKKLLLFITFIMVVQSASAYPNHEISAILKEKYPNAIFGSDILLQDDGNGAYVRYSSYPIPNATEMEMLWQIVQNKRNATAINQTIANRIKTNYSVAMADLDTIQNGNPPFTQAGFNQVVWAQKREAAVLQDILRFLKWYYWDNR